VDVGAARDAITGLIGLGAGILSGLFGVGGGVLSQPGMRAVGIEPLVVIGSALPVIIPGALSGAIRYSRESLVRWPAVWATVPAGLVFAVLGGVAGEHVPGDGHLLQIATALLLGLSAWRMTKVRSPLPPDEPLAETDAPEAPQPRALVMSDDGQGHGRSPEVGGNASRRRRYISIGALAGGLSGLLGIGGGVVMVPAFVQAARMDVKQAIATSLVCVGAFAVPGTVTHVVLGHVDWRVVAALVIGAVPGARLGAVLTIRIDEDRLRPVVGTFLGITAVIYFVGELLALL
jgi:uncharacterized membrane protein YfcA